jgi:hypothetical protein
VNRRACVIAVPLALLTACGGGGKSSSLPPVGSSPQSKKIGTATFSFKLPGKNTMSKVRRPYYQSQAAQGVAIDWLSTNPSVPDYSAAISATCPATLPADVVSCTIDAQGDTDYTFQLQIPAGTYPNFTVTTFDAPPMSGGTFSGNMLAQGQLAAPVVIVGGTSNTVPALTFYGIPASVSFQPGPAQSHVVTYGGNLAVIGNAPQTFFAQAVDADGFVISSNDTGAPAITAVESSSDSPQEFTVSTISSANELMLAAKNANGNATINVTATPGGTGLSAVTTSYTVTPVQEMWTTQSSGGSATNYGVSGYPLYPSPGPTPLPPTQPSGALDYANPQICGGQCNWQYAAMDPSGNIWAIASGYGVFEFKQASASQGVIAPSSASVIPLGTTPQSIAIDANSYLYLVDSYASTISIYNTKSPSATPLTTIADTNGVPASIAVAPASAGSIAGDIFVGDSSGITVFSPYGGGGTPPAQAGQIVSGVGYPEGLAFDPTGAFWEYDEEDGLVEVGSASTNSASFSATVAVYSSDGAEQLGVTAQQVAFMGGPPSYNGIVNYPYVGGSLGANPINLSLSDTFSVMIAP